MKATLAALLASLTLTSTAVADGGYLRVSTANDAVQEYAEAHADQMHAYGGFSLCRRRLTVRAIDCWAGYQHITDETGTYDFYERVTVRLRRGVITVTSVAYDEPPYIAKGVGK